MLSHATIHAALEPARRAVWWGTAVVGILALAAFLEGGAAGALAAAIGGGVGIGFGRALAAGLAAVVRDPARAGRARWITITAAFIRYPMLGAALGGAILVLDLPLLWLAAGVMAWPLALTVVALRMQHAGLEEA